MRAWPHSGVGDGNSERTLQPPMNANTPKTMMQLVVAIERGKGDQKKSFWTRIGVAFENKDGSWNLRFDYLPARPDATIRLRHFDPKEETPHEEPETRVDTTEATNATPRRARR
jgi:hypothetical protein